MMLEIKLFEANGFKNAIEGKLLTKSVMEVLSALGITPENSVFGYSTCRDEINRTVTEFKSYFKGQEFPHGWLAGYPGSGITGFSAHSHHSPNASGENTIIFYGPHIGIGEKGVLGKVLRRGQKHESPSCGATIQFLKRCRQAAIEGKTYEPTYNDEDAEQYTIERELSRYSKRILFDEKGKILPENEQIKMLVEVNYDVVDETVLKRIDRLKESFEGDVVLIGGVMLNTDYPNPQYVDLRRFEMQKHNGEIENLMERLREMI